MIDPQRSRALSTLWEFGRRHAPAMFRFGLVGISGLVVNTLALLMFGEGFDVYYLYAVIAATQFSTTWNFFLTEHYVFQPATKVGRWKRLLGFFALNNGALVVRGPIVVFLTETMGMHYAVGNFWSLVVVMLVRYAFSAGVLWRPSAAERQSWSHRGASYATNRKHTRATRALMTPRERRPWWQDPRITVTALGQRRASYLKNRKHTRATRALMTPRERRPWWRDPRITVISLSLLTLVLRFWSIGALGLNSDEAVYTGQGASLAGLAPFTEHFSIFRAHPLLFQYVVAAVVRVSFWDTAGRWVAAGFGLATLWITFRLTERLVSRRSAWIATGFLAVMPYHVVVSRQALLESPMAFFMALTMYALIRYQDNRTFRAALGIGAAAGLAFLSKETAIIVLLSVGIFVALRGSWKTSRIAVGLVTFGFVISPHLFSSLSGSSAEGEGGSGWTNYLLWQLSRPPNHPASFYISNAAHYFGPPMLVLAVIGAVWLIVKEGRRTDRSVMLLAWAGVPALVFQLYPVKGYHYLIPIAPAAAIFAAIGVTALGTWLRAAHVQEDIAIRAVNWSIGLSLAGAIFVSAVNGPIVLNYERIGEAGYSGLPGVRDLTTWISEDTPEGSRFLGIGPSITNVIAFYSDRDTLALSVSPNPLRRNPAYDVVRNADYDVRWGQYEYLIYDGYSAQRTSHFANRVLDLAERYSTEVAYQSEGTFVAEDGEPFIGPIFRVYRVAPIGSTLIDEDEE